MISILNKKNELCHIHGVIEKLLPISKLNKTIINKLSIMIYEKKIINLWFYVNFELYLSTRLWF